MMAFEEDDYRQRYVVFLDLLGFKRQVERAENDAAERAKLREVLEIVRDCLCENARIGSHLTCFSDCIVFSTDRNEAGLAELFQSVRLLTDNLLQRDVLLRGGLTAGGAHHGRTFLYGTAVSRAYVIESTSAANPLVLLSEEVVSDIQGYNEGFTAWLREDGPGRYFMHYLISYEMYRSEPIVVGTQILDEPAARIIAYMWKRLNSDTGQVLEKAKWFQSYWNKTVGANGEFGHIEAGVIPKYFPSGPPATGYRRTVG